MIELLPTTVKLPSGRDEYFQSYKSVIEKCKPDHIGELTFARTTPRKQAIRAAHDFFLKEVARDTIRKSRTDRQKQHVWLWLFGGLQEQRARRDGFAPWHLHFAAAYEKHVPSCELLQMWWYGKPGSSGEARFKPYDPSQGGLIYNLRHPEMGETILCPRQEESCKGKNPCKYCLPGALESWKS